MATQPVTRRSRGVLKPLLITLAVLLTLVIVAALADGLARTVAQERVAGQVQQELGLAQPPQVELGGTPFLVTLITRELPSATLTATDVPVEVSGKQITLDTATVTAENLTLAGTDVHVDSGRAQALIGYPALSTLAGAQVEAGGEAGRLQVSYTAELLGRELVAVVSAVPVLDKDASLLELTQTEISVVGVSLSPEVSQWVIDELVKPIELELPYGLEPDAITVMTDGVEVAVTASDLTVPLQ